MSAENHEALMNNNTELSNYGELTVEVKFPIDTSRAILRRK